MRKINILVSSFYFCYWTFFKNTWRNKQLSLLDTSLVICSQNYLAQCIWWLITITRKFWSQRINKSIDWSSQRQQLPHQVVPASYNTLYYLQISILLALQQIPCELAIDNASSLSNRREHSLLYDARARSYENCIPVLSQFSHSSADLRLVRRWEQYIDKGTNFLRLLACR